MTHYYLPNAHWNSLPPHMRAPLRAYIMRGEPPGKFLRAVLENDLARAVRYADDTNMRCLLAWVKFLRNSTPVASHGGPGIVDAWIAKGGLAGHSAQTEEENQ